ncbi:unnamed protein product [Auanema sp. JU1783]|nr:unnamed protein product [Auanema sp. JU1783]
MADLANLNKSLATQAYVEGFVPSGADTKEFDKITSAPDAKKFPHVARWFNHISSFDKKERQDWASAGGSAQEADDDIDLFGSDDEDDAEKQKIVAERLKAYNEKKSAKPGPIAKSSVILDVKPWDDETDLAKMEENVRSITMDGLVWGGGKLIPIGYGIKKFQIICIIEDLKVSVDDLIEKITGDFEDFVQSVDIVAFNKI